MYLSATQFTIASGALDTPAACNELATANCASVVSCCAVAGSEL